MNKRNNNHMSQRPRNFAHTGTMVDYWCNINHPGIALKPNEFSVDDVKNGDVMGFYYDNGINNECTITLDKPTDGYGAIYVGEQKNTFGLRWYDKNALFDLIKHDHGEDPDTREQWGQFMNINEVPDRSIKEDFRYVLPMSALHRWVLSGQGRQQLYNLRSQMKAKTGLYQLPPY